MVENPTGKELTGKTPVRREDVFRNHMETLNGGLDWKARVVNRDMVVRRDGLDGRQIPEEKKKKKKKKKHILIILRILHFLRSKN